MACGDAELLVRWQAGDAQAGRSLVDRHFLGVHRFFRSTFPADADELTQQTFLAVVESRDAIRSGDSLRAYVFRIARRQLHGLVRERARVELKDSFDTLSAEAVGGSPSRAAVQRQHDRLLLRALRQLPLDDQIALELRYWERLSVHEVAMVLGTSDTATKSRLMRGRARVERLMEAHARGGLGQVSTQDSLELWASRVADHVPRLA